jgi:hypothetical protein
LAASSPKSTAANVPAPASKEDQIARLSAILSAATIDHAL